MPVKKAVPKPFKVPPRTRYKTALGNLTAAYRLLQRKGAWTQKSFAVDCHYKELIDDNIRSGRAVAFCAMGAVKFIDGPGEKKAAELLSQAASKILYGQFRSPVEDDVNVFGINDDENKARAKKRVFRMFEKAIAEARKIRPSK